MVDSGEVGGVGEGLQKKDFRASRAESVVAWGRAWLRW